MSRMSTKNAHNAHYAHFLKHVIVNALKCFEDVKTVSGA